MRGRARRATYHRNSTYSLEVASGLARWVSDTLFSHHMADIIATDHDRRDGHAGFLADFNCIQVSTNAGTSPLENVSRV